MAAVDNGNIISHEPYRAMQRQAFAGKTLAITKGKGVGKFTVKVEAQGLEVGR